MKTLMLSLLFVFGFMKDSVAQPKDYKPLLNQFFQHAENSFKDIAGEPNDTSIFSPSKLNADVGEVKIGRYPNVVTLNWIVPLAQSQKIQIDVREYIRARFSGNKNYEVVSDGTEAAGYKTTSVYAVNGNEKPLLVFKTIYYKSKNENKKSNFTMTIYGK